MIDVVSAALHVVKPAATFVIEVHLVRSDSVALRAQQHRSGVDPDAEQGVRLLPLVLS
jgi:hypothetical protein